MSWTKAADSTGTAKFRAFAIPEGAQSSADVAFCDTADASTTSCLVGVKPGLAYEYGVVGLDKAGNQGDFAYGEAATAVVPGPTAATSVPKADGTLTSDAKDGRSTGGGQVTVTGTGFLPGSTVALVVYSTPVKLGEAVVLADGTFSATVTLPKDLANGAHHLVATGVDANGNTRNLVVEVTVSGGTAAVTAGPALAKTGFSALPWAGAGALALLAAFCLGTVALRRGEHINALWIVVAAVSIYLIAYRFYGLFIADKVMQLDPTRATPAVTNNDGLDYVPTNKHVLFGHHFAAIAGAGPLVGPVLAAQMGYLPGLLWLVVGVVLAGAVQDFMVLFLSTRRNGRSLGDLVREEMGQVPGTIALFGAFLIMIIILAVLAMVVVKALAESPWGMFTVIATMPIAIMMGVYMRYIRPGKIGEISVVGLILLLGAIWLGGQVAADPTWGPAFTFTGVQITWMLIGYGFVFAFAAIALAPAGWWVTEIGRAHV